MFWHLQNSAEPDWVQVLIWVLIMAGVFISLYLTRRTERKLLLALAQELGGNYVNRFFKGAYVSLSREPTESRVRLLPKTRYTPPILLVEQLAPLDFRLRLDVRTPWYKRQTFFFDGLKKFTLGDPVFDEAFQLRTNDETRAAYWLNDGRRRQTIMNLVQSGFTYFGAGKKNVEIKMPNYKDVDLSAERIKIYLAAFDELTRRLARLAFPAFRRYLPCQPLRTGWTPAASAPSTPGFQKGLRFHGFDLGRPVADSVLVLSPPALGRRRARAAPRLAAHVCRGRRPDYRLLVPARPALADGAVFSRQRRGDDRLSA